MPDTISALDAVMRMPNLGLCSIAGNLEGYGVKIVDLAFRNHNLTRSIRRLMEEFNPDIVGLSAMSFQYNSACRVSRICRSVKPDVSIVLGGYHATQVYEEIANGPEAPLFDFLVRGEGEVTFRRLVEAIGSGGNGFEQIPGLSFLER